MRHIFCGLLLLGSPDTLSFPVSPLILHLIVPQVAPVLAVIAVATVAAIAVIAYHAPGPTELLAKPHAFTKNGDCLNV